MNNTFAWTLEIKECYKMRLEILPKIEKSPHVNILIAVIHLSWTGDPFVRTT